MSSTHQPPRPATPDVVRLADLQTHKPTPFRIVPDKTQLVNIAKKLDLLDLRKVVFEGHLAPAGATDWRLTANLGASAVQPCSITLAPVKTRLEAAVVRLYTAAFSNPTDSEAEMPDDDTLEPLPESVNLAELLIEALAIALPDYPRANDAALDQAVFSQEGVAPLQDADLKPFAGLAALKAAMKGE